jgi:hypothetical protein
MATGKFGLSVSVWASTACAYQSAADASSAYVFEKKYAVPVFESMTGVPVTPTNDRSVQPKSEPFQLGPKVRDATIVPVAASSA